MDLDRIGNRVRMILAFTLVLQDKLTDETLNPLLRAQSEFPQARLLSARVYAAQGRRDEAKAAIQDYLDSGSTEGEYLAHEWLSILKKSAQIATASVR